MKWILILIFSGAAVFGIIEKNHHSTKGSAKNGDQGFVVLELFTSEGCSSCPPADRLLPQLASLGAGVIPLSFHVDYWDRMGWKDPFSDHAFTSRQGEYGQHFKLESIYTPQLIINGEYELVGSDKTAAETDIRNSLKEKANTELAIKEVRKEANKLSVSCHLSGNWQNSDLLAAIVQRHAESDVKAGENKGARLSHTNVVRVFLRQPARENMSFEIEKPGEISDDNWELVLYTQEKSSLRITGAIVYSPPHNQ